MKLPASDRETLAILAAARRIWTAVRNRNLGGELNSERYESMIVEAITAVVVPYRERIEELDAERRDFSKRSNEAYNGICKMKAAIRDVLASNGKPSVKTLEMLKRLERTGFQHCRCKIVDEGETETQEAEEDENAVDTDS